MGLILKGIFGLILAFTFYSVITIYTKLSTVPKTPVYEDIWWGKGDPAKENTNIKPFKVDISKEIIDDLKYRLQHAVPFQQPLEGVKQHYGMNTNLLTKIVDYWKNNYNWTERQEFLNQFPQYTISIQGLKIHYIHVKPQINKQSNIKVLPLMLLHGWPGSVREFYELIPLLTTPQKGRKVVFEVIAPSLPGYGFSEASNKPGLNTARAAQIFKNLMGKLGFNMFYVQGGDWGALIVNRLSILYPENILGAHSNMCSCMSTICNIKFWLLGGICPSLIGTKEEIPQFSPIFKKFVQDLLFLEMGYMHLQATKPDTVGVALRDSPVGLAAYIIEKFTSWTNPEWKNLDDGGLTRKFTYEKLLDNVMIYWVTRSITTSQRFYAENFNKAFMAEGLNEIPVTVPTACARFKHELSIQPKSILKHGYLNLVQTTDFEDGGHFAAFEVPDLLANDVYDFIKKVV
ncbi:hypothetical protein ABEB36_003783 [Hypothenemus hampei]|uniref:Epoxide hydrolase n=1 Tax=Hypothenemus hampei TaxID=57062 RepID=A0ABD1F138_HYPHA